MKSFPVLAQTILVLQKGEELIESLSKYATDQNLKSAWVNVIGGASSVTLGFREPDLKEYFWKEFNEPLEIIGLQGNLAYVDGQPIWHIHGTFSKADYSVIGGHVKTCTIGLTGEVFLKQHDHEIIRKFDKETGLNLIKE